VSCVSQHRNKARRAPSALLADCAVGFAGTPAAGALLGAAPPELLPSAPMSVFSAWHSAQNLPSSDPFATEPWRYLWLGFAGWGSWQLVQPSVPSSWSISPGTLTLLGFMPTGWVEVRWIGMIPWFSLWQPRHSATSPEAPEPVEGFFSAVFGATERIALPFALWIEWHSTQFGSWGPYASAGAAPNAIIRAAVAASLLMCLLLSDVCLSVQGVK